MVFVIDTSVTMAWCFEDEATESTERLLDELRTDHAVAPALWRLEVANVLLVAERRRRLTEAQSVRFVELLTRLPIQVDDAPLDVDSSPPDASTDCPHVTPRTWCWQNDWAQHWPPSMTDSCKRAEPPACSSRSRNGDIAID